MWENRTGIRTHVLSYVALLICLSILSCASPEGGPVGKMVSQQGAREHLAKGQKGLAQHNYQASLQEFEAALSLSGNKPPGDEVLLNIGMVYADPENPKRDFSKSIASFQRLLKEYSQSQWAEPVRIWMETLREQEKLKWAMIETLKEQDRLKRLSSETAQENQKLKEIAKQSNMVDVEIDKKKKGSGL